MDSQGNWVLDLDGFWPEAMPGFRFAPWFALLIRQSKSVKRYLLRERRSAGMEIPGGYNSVLRALQKN